MSNPLNRRRGQRYPVTLKVQFTILDQKRVVGRSKGEVLDASTSGLFLTSQTPIRPGSILQLVIKWPVRPPGVKRVDWIVRGVAVRTGPLGTGVNIIRQRFERQANKIDEKKNPGQMPRQTLRGKV